MGKLSQVREAIPSGGRAVFTAYNKKIADDIGLKLAQPRKNFHPSEQQQLIFDWVKDPEGMVLDGKGPVKLWKKNAMIEAVAGAGKTTTLVEICHLLNMQVSSSTFHSIGFRAWQGAVGRVQVKGEKIDDLMEEHDVPKNLRAFVGKLTSLAKQRGIGVEGLATDHPEWGDDPWIEIIDHFDLEELLPMFQNLGEAIGKARSILHASIAESDKVVDFEDMIYMPLQADIQIPQFDWVLVDEYQDTNPTRRELARRMLGPGGRFVGVGDPHQAIYGFTGADNDAMDLGVRLFDCVRLPLNVTYRCPQAVVRHAQQWVSHIQAHPSAPEGAVRSLTLKEFNQLLDRTSKAAVPRPYGVGFLHVEDAILCRNTQPLIETAFDLIRRRIPCHVEGRDIGQGLISLVKKWKKVQYIFQLRNMLEVYLEEESLKFIKRGRRDKVASLEDKVGTLMVFMASMHDDDTIWKLIESINSLFKDTETGKKAATVTLSTIHKAKGREWKRVYWLGRNILQPSPYARQAWELEQEWNLCYVAATRPMEELIEVIYPLPGEEGFGEEEAPLSVSGYVETDVSQIEERVKNSVAEPRLAEPLKDEDPWAHDPNLCGTLECPGCYAESYRPSHGATQLPAIEEQVKRVAVQSLTPEELHSAHIYQREAVERMEAFLAAQQQLRDGGLTNDSEVG
jgi:DNA helicase-2/ATP-dependent DNA helicase PcrA